MARSDIIYSAIADQLTEAQYVNIHTKNDMRLKEYQSLQKKLNELRKLEFARYLYTARKDADGRIVYLVDGLDLSAEDFAYPGTPLEEEMIPYIERALFMRQMMTGRLLVHFVLRWIWNLRMRRLQRQIIRLQRWRLLSV